MNARAALGVALAPLVLVGVACTTGLDLGGDNASTDASTDVALDAAPSTRNDADTSTDAPSSYVDAGAPLVLATTDGTPAALVLANGYAYWADGSSIYRVLDGVAGSGKLFAPPPFSGGQIYALAADASYVYSWRTDDGSSALGHLRRTELASGTSTDLETSGIASPQALASDGTSVFVGLTTHDETDAFGHPTPVQGGLFYVADGGYVAPLIADAGDCAGLVVRGQSLVWHSSAYVVSAQKDGNAATPIGTAQGGLLTYVSGVAVTDGGVYWAESTAGGAGGGIFRAGTAGGAPLKLAAASPDGTSAPGAYTAPIAADDSFVYWGEADSLRRVAVGGGAVEIVSAESSPVTSIVLDGANVYWAVGTSLAGGAIKQLPKP